MRRGLSRLLRTYNGVSVIAIVLALTAVSEAQNLPLVIAWQAPDDTTICQNGMKCFDNFIQHELPYISGIGMTIQWGDIDSCFLTKPCQDTTDDCTDTANYQWCALDNILVDYIGHTAFANKKIVLIIRPTNDGGKNSFHQTPKYVFSNTWATSPGVNALQPQDQIVCQDWQGDIDNTAGSCPVRGTFVKGQPDFAIWNVSQCDHLSSPDLSCQSLIACSTPYLDISGFPIVYEKPFVVAYQTFLRALVQHYNPITGSTNGRQIAPYIAYMRVGMANAGESLPQCATKGSIPQESWPGGAQVPAGYIVNVNNTQYVATAAGMTGGTSQTCSPAGCNTAPDAAVPSWYNSGPYTPGSSANRMWPGPAGHFSGEPQSYSDNGYLSEWSNINEGTGYVASMATFLRSLNASFPFDMSAHTGPPGNKNSSYPDSETAIAYANSIGFGMQSVNVGDGLLYAAGTYPTSRENWAHNFRVYVAPVHHLQTNAPGSTYFAEGYKIDNIQVDATGNATIYCPTTPNNIDCSPFSGDEIYITGNSNNSLDGVWPVQCTGANAPQCDPNTLQFVSNLTTCPMPPTPCGTGGVVWGPDYWPIVLPFAVQHEVSSVEIWECSLDYAFGAWPSFPTTTWVTSPTGPSGCATWGVVGLGPSGTDPGYQNALGDTQIGQPPATSVRTGTSILVNGTQF